MSDRATLFRSLHHGPKILVLPNAWDAASARIFEAACFPAMATPTETRFDRTVERMAALGSAGADCVFVPGVRDEGIYSAYTGDTMPYPEANRLFRE